VTRRHDALFAAAAMALALVGAIVVLELWNADQRVPFADTGDATLNLILVKDAIDNPWYLENSRLGAPDGLELYDYPVVSGDTLNLVLLRVLAIGSGDPALAMNLFFLLTFPLTALIAFLVLRRLGADEWAALVCSVLYALVPYHFLRGEIHLFLAAYYVVPVAAYLALAVLAGDELLRGRRRLLATVGLAVLVAVASGSFYYSAFAVILVVVAALLRFLATRNGRALIAGGLVVGVVLAVSLLQLAPTIAYRAVHGRNDAVAKRFTFESEVYSLKLTQLLLPLDDHRIDALARLKQRYTAHFPNGDAKPATLGAVGAAGFLWLLVVALAAVVGRRARGRHPDLAAMAVVSFMLATVGGLGVFVGALWPETRAWNRLSIFIAFFALAAVALGLGALRGRLARPLYVGLLVVVLALGVLDQTSSAYIPSYDAIRTEWRDDDGFFDTLEHRLPDDAMVVQLPYETFPEPPNALNGGYEPAKAYLHSDDLRWSYGAMRGRDDWAATIAAKPPPELVAGARRDRFAGILLDRLAYGAQAPQIESELRRLLTPPPIVSTDRRYVFFRL